MPDYSDSRGPVGGAYPINAGASGWGRLEPLLSPEQLVQRWLFGVPLVSAWRVPGHATDQRISADMLQDHIRRAVSTLEDETHTIVMPTQIEDERHAFDRQEFESFGYFNLRNKPVASIESLTIMTPDQTHIFQVPQDWIERGHLVRGRIYIVPLSPAASSATFASLSGGSAYGLTMMQHMRGMSNNIPGYWAITYTAGFVDGLLPVVVNELVGIIAAQQVLGLLAPTFARSGSHSLGIDGLSQSVSTPGAELFKVRMQELEEIKQKRMKSYRALFGAKIRVGAI